MHDTSLINCNAFIKEYLSESDKLLIADVGSYDVNGNYRMFFDRDNWTYIGLDITAGPNVDLVIPERDWTITHPSLSESFDVVVSGQCLEHVRKPWLWIKDVVSLAKPNALIWITAPNTWGFHEYPIDCWRIWPDGMRALFDEAGIVDISCFICQRDTIGIGRKRT